MGNPASVLDANDRERELERLRPHAARAREFTGWGDFGIVVRRLDPGPPWDYADLVRRYADAASSALDMGTGGGEFLAEIRESLPRRTCATEPWMVNAPIASARLAPLGIRVVQCHSRQLPFADTTFDLVLNRHEELDPVQVARVLRRGGYIVTQQVGNGDWRELREFFPRMTDWGDLRGEYAVGFTSAGLQVIVNQQHKRQVAYPTLGDVVFMLTVAPWTIPDFDVERDLDALLALEARCGTEQGIVLTEERFVQVAQKA